jgi:hypothetical protein
LSLRLVLGREELGGEGGPRLGWVEQLSRLLLLLLLLGVVRRQRLKQGHRQPSYGRRRLRDVGGEGRRWKERGRERRRGCLAHRAAGLVRAEGA